MIVFLWKTYSITEQLYVPDEKAISGEITAEDSAPIV